MSSDRFYGFLFKAGGKTSLKISLDVNDSEVLQKMEALRKYLFEDFYGDVVENPTIAPYNDFPSTTGMYGCVRTAYSASSLCNNDKVGSLYKKFHGGLDISAAIGTELKSIISGVVSFVNDVDNNDLGKYVQITSTLPDGRGITYVYGHMQTISVSNGASVVKGAVLGTSGETGNAIDVVHKHCHVQVKIDGVLSDPNGRMKTQFDENGNAVN